MARLRASLLFFNYTLAGSLGILVAILAIWALGGSTDLTLLSYSLEALPVKTLTGVWWAAFIAVAVKTPLYPFHT